MTLGYVNLLGYYSNPAYEKVFSKATPSISIDSLIEPPRTYLIPIKSLSNRLVSRLSTAETTISPKNVL
jgi:hypothetical protein